MSRTRLHPEHIYAGGLLVPVTAVGFWLKYGAVGPGSGWCRDHGAGALYELFWVLALRAVLPQARIGVQVGAVFACTCLLEFLQLARMQWLEALRATLAGQVLLGSAFDWADFPAYALGCASGWLLAHHIRARSAAPPPVAG